MPSGYYFGRTQVSAGSNNTCMLQSNGSLACWGRNDYGQSTPPSGTFIQVSSGQDFACGLQSDGSLACWGDPTYNRTTPPGGTFTQFSAGTFHGCGLQSDGTLACWGGAWYGEISPPAGTFTVTANYIQTCFTLTRTHTGSGSDPTASPTNSSGCSSGQYLAGESISLTATPAAGWAVGSWSGTNNDLSTSITNSVVMPASTLTVTANYTLIIYRIYLPLVIR